MVDMKELLVQTACENSATWLGLDEANEGVANALTRDTLYWSKDKNTKKVNKKYPPTMKAKIGFGMDDLLLMPLTKRRSQFRILRLIFLRVQKLYVS